MINIAEPDFNAEDFSKVTEKYGFLSQSRQFIKPEHSFVSKEPIGLEPFSFSPEFPKFVCQVQPLILNDGNLYGFDPLSKHHHLGATIKYLPITTNISFADMFNSGDKISAQYQPYTHIATLITISTELYLTRLFYIHEGAIPQDWGIYEGEFNQIFKLQQLYPEPITISIGKL